MSTTFPTSKQSIPNPTSTDLLENADNTLDHDYQHSTLNDTVEALQDKVGIDGSATNTSHDYKLSGVATGDKAVSLTGTEVLTNKTLTSPQINFGTNATGDIYYRDGSGVFQRLPIGSTDQILAVSSGLPAWIANPSASAASDTVAGIVELATTAETETGTDATRAVTPDGLHDMTTLAGAAWFLDEDDMTSDSATKTASQQSIKAYVDNSLANTVNAIETTSDWMTVQIKMNDTDLWTLSATNKTKYATGGNLNQTGSINTDSTALTTSLFSLKTGAAIAFSSTTVVKLKFSASAFPGSGTTNIGRWQFIGFADSVAEAVGNLADTTRKRVGFNFYNGRYYAVVCSGSATSSTDLGAYSATAFKRYAISLNGTTDAKFYVDGSLVATLSTNLPSSTTFGIGAAGYVGASVTDSGFSFISDFVYSEKLT